MLIIKYEKTHRIKKKLEDLYIPKTASQNNNIINNQLAKTLFASVYYNNCYF